MQRNKSCLLRVTQVSLCAIVLIAFITYTAFYYYEKSWTLLPQFRFFKRIHGKFILPHPEYTCTKKSATFSKITIADLYESGHSNEVENFNKICPDNGYSVQLLMVILSAPTHFSYREAIRKTWGHKSPGVAVAFLLGNVQDPDIEDRLSVENVLYKDLIRGHSLDSYGNLTLKTLSMLEWTWKHCSKAKFLLKTDDDTFINMPKLLELVEARANATRSIFGRLAVGSPVDRNRSSKWYVSREEYGLERYPAYTTGPAYLLTTDVIQDLYCEALGMPFFKLEDVFFTGLVAKRFRLALYGVEEFLNIRVEPSDVGHCKLKHFISIHGLAQVELFELWKQLHESSDRC